MDNELEVTQTEKFPWHSMQWEFLLKQLANNRLAAAYLFSGPIGLGKVDFALQFAQTLLCAEHTTCGSCAGCRLFLTAAHPDFHYIHPEEGSAKIKVDAVRELSHKLTSSAQQGGYKVAIIAPAEGMNTAASNALLKTLEEPAANTVIILVSAHPNYLTATIQSRCQKLLFQYPIRDVAIKWLQKHDVKNANESYALSENAPLLALQYAQDEELMRQYQQSCTALIEYINSRDPLAAAAKTKDLPVQAVLNWWQLLILDVLRVQTGSDIQTHLIYRSDIEQLATANPAPFLLEMLQYFQSLQKQLHKQGQLNLQLALENTLIEISQSYA